MGADSTSTINKFRPQRVKAELGASYDHFMAFVAGTLVAAKEASPMCIRQSARLKSQVGLPISVVPPSPLTPSRKLDSSSPPPAQFPSVTVLRLQLESLVSVPF